MSLNYFPLVREKLEREEQARQSAFKARMDSLEQSAKKYDLKVGSKIQVSSHTYIHTYTHTYINTHKYRYIILFLHG